ncbi:hypothetical protein [Thiolapillus sp.]|uniref:hypothetical protein n=1 Tax=Thiolapillus sp. TaxID=2017437 RepID=UPI003AF63D4E
MKALSTLEANLRCADVTDGLAGEEEELTKLVERLDKATTAYGMEEQCPEDQAYDQTTTQKSKQMDRSLKLSPASGTCAYSS